MTTPPSERLLDLLGDPAARAIARHLATADATQRELVAAIGLSQSVASRALALMRAAGLVDSEGLRSPLLRLRARDETVALLLAVDHLAERLGALDVAAQATRTNNDRRLALRSTDVDDEANSSPPA
jgi:DNA-binding transcriptional ArsR family regulator